jgi:hypothetical protein
MNSERPLHAAAQPITEATTRRSVMIVTRQRGDFNHAVCSVGLTAMRRTRLMSQSSAALASSSCRSRSRLTLIAVCRALMETSLYVRRPVLLLRSSSKRRSLARSRCPAKTSKRDTRVRSSKNGSECEVRPAYLTLEHRWCLETRDRLSFTGSRGCIPRRPQEVGAKFGCGPSQCEVRLKSQLTRQHLSCCTARRTDGELSTPLWIGAN